MPLFVVTYTYGDPETRTAARPRHLAYLRHLHGQGKLREAGPFADQRGGMIVYDAEDEAAARALLAADPYNEAGALRDVQVREWNLVLP